MSAARCPSHLLLLYKPLGDELVDCRFHKPRRYALPAAMALSVVDDSGRVVVDISDLAPRVMVDSTANIFSDGARLS
jgi:hypothetical protein